MSKPSNRAIINSNPAASNNSSFHLRRDNIHQIESAKTTEEITAKLAAENERRLNDLGGGIGRAFAWLFGKDKQSVKPEESKQNFDAKLDEEIAKKPVKLELQIPKKNCYARIPEPSIYDPAITVAEKTVVELRTSENAATTLIKNGSDTFENRWQRGLDRFYLLSKRKEITRSKADSLGEPLNNNGSWNFSSLEAISSDFTAAANFNKTNPLPRFYNGLAHLYEGALKESQIYLKSAIELDSKLIWSNHFLALTHTDRQNKIAKKHYEIEMENNPNTYSLLQLAQIDFEEKKYDHALTKLQEVSRFDPLARLTNLKMSKIYHLYNNTELELDHLNQELKNAHHHRDQKLINLVSRDLGYYHLRNNNPQAALEYFDYVSSNRMAHDRYTPNHIFDRFYAVAAIEGPEVAEKKLLTITRDKFVKTSLVPIHEAAPVYYNSYKLLAEFRIAHYGFNAARENLESSIKKSEELSEPTTEQSAIKLSLKTELATLLFVHSKSIRHEPGKSQLLQKSKDLISEDSENRSYRFIKKDLVNFITKRERQPATTTHHASHQKLQPTLNISQSNSI